MQSKAKRRRRQGSCQPRGEAAQRRQVRERSERQRARRKAAVYEPWRKLTRNQAEVAKRLTAGQVTLVTISGWGFVAEFLAFLEQLGYWALLELEGRGYQRVLIPLGRLVLTYQFKILLGISSMNQVPAKLFREVALLQLIGYTTAQVQAGFCQRGHLASGPMHKNTLADALERFTAEEIESVFNGAIQRLVTQGFFAGSHGHFALDATDLETTPRYEGAEVKKHVDRRVDKHRQVVEVERFVHGFKVLIVYEVRLRLVVAAKVVPINDHESQYTLALVRQALTNLGDGVLRVLLLDRGFLDGQDLWTLKHTLGIDFVVPAKTDMRVAADARGLCRQAADGETLFTAERTGKPPDAQGKREGQVSLVGIAALRSYDQYGTSEHKQSAHRKDFQGNLLHTIVVTKWQGSGYLPGHEKVFLTSLPVHLPLEILDLYDLRSLIENTAFRELKQGWCLTRYPKKSRVAVRSHVLLTLLTFTLANAFRTQAGQDLAHHGIRRHRTASEIAQVVVLAGSHYAFFHIEDLLRLLGVVPEISLRPKPGPSPPQLCGSAA